MSLLDGPFEIQEREYIIIRKILIYAHSDKFETDECLRRALDRTVSINIDHNEEIADYLYENKLLECSSAVRPLVISFGKNLESINLSGCTSLNDNIVETICSHTERLKLIDFSHCSNIGDKSCRAIARFCGETVVTLKLSHCGKITSEACGWLTGRISQCSPNLKKVRHLDISQCVKIDNHALIYIGGSFRKLLYLNVANCDKITNRGLEAIASGCFALKVVNLRGCSQISNKGIIKLAQKCKSLISLNLSSIGPITNKSMNAISLNCRKIQTLSIEGAYSVNERGLCRIAKFCRDLVLLNITGCNVTRTALLALAKGIGYVKEANMFLGLEPLQDSLELKMKHQKKIIIQKAASTIQNMVRLFLTRNKAKRLKKIVEMDRAALDIQLCFQRHLSRCAKLQLWSQQTGAVTIQKNYRMWVCQRRMTSVLLEKRELLRKSVSIVSIQKIYRAHLTRLRNHHVDLAIYHLRCSRLRNKQVVSVIRIQTFARKIAAVKILREKEKIWVNRNNSVLILQMIVRSYLAKEYMYKLQLNLKYIEQVKFKASTLIQNWYRVRISKVLLVFLKAKSREREENRMKTIVYVQSCVRRFLANVLIRSLKHEVEQKHEASINIQKYFRGSRVLPWRNMKFNQVAWFILSRAKIEHTNSESRSQLLRYHNTLDYDSDSSSAELGSDLEEPSNNIIDFGVSLIGLSVRIFWPLNNESYEGIITKYNKQKRFWQVRYDDNDIEWIDFRKNQDRVDIFSDGSWKSFGMYSPIDLHTKQEFKTRENELYQRINDKKQIALGWEEMGYNKKRKKWSYYNPVINQTVYISDRQLFYDWDIIECTNNNDYTWYYQQKHSGIAISWDEPDPRGFTLENFAGMEEYQDIKRKILSNLRYYTYICQGSIEDYFVIRSIEELKQFFKRGFLKKLGLYIVQARNVWGTEDFENDKELKYFVTFRNEVNDLSRAILADN